MADYPVGTQVKFNQSPVKKNITIKSTKLPPTLAEAKLNALKKKGADYGAV
jgi:hypothetical protein